MLQYVLEKYSEKISSLQCLDKAEYDPCRENRLWKTILAGYVAICTTFQYGMISAT